MTEEVSKFTARKLNSTKQIELPTFDVDKHNGSTAIIESIDEGDMQTKFGVKPIIKVLSNVIDTFNGKEVRVSKTFWLSENKQTKELGWTQDSDLAKFLLSKKVAHYNDLVGKKIVLVVESDTKTQKTYLTMR